MIVGKHALVTGGGSGVGRSIALALAEADIAVTICGRRKEPLAATARESARLHAIACDVTKEAEVTALFAEAEKVRGPFDIVVANAGMSGSSPAHRTSLADWQSTLDVNLTGSFLSVKKRLPPARTTLNPYICWLASAALKSCSRRDCRLRI